MDPCNWVTRDQYNKHANGSTFQAMGGTLSSIASFPGVSSSLTGTIGQDIVDSHWIKLPKHQWPVQTRAKAGGPIAKILCSDLQVSKNVITWEMMMLGPYLERLILQKNIVDVSMAVKKQKSS
jgi:hypothetical protein